MTEHSLEPLPLVPYDRPEYVTQQITRIAFMHKMLQPDGYGEPGAVLLPTDHDGDKIPETLELILTEREMWRLYSDELLLPNREAFLAETPTGQTISGHLTMLEHLGRWANLDQQKEQIIPRQPQPQPDALAVAMWAINNLGIDIENV